jgi:diguanylate cyclase (GGDEF)-like protein
MDPATVALMLGVHLAGVGFLLFAMSRQRARRSGLTAWAASLMLLGLALFLRLDGAQQESPEGTLPVDITVVTALLLFHRGMRQFLGTAPSRFPVLVLAAGYAVLHSAVALGLGSRARLVELNLTVGILFALLAWQAMHEGRRLPARNELRLPLFGLSALLGIACLSALGRPVLIARLGPQAMDIPPFAEAYFGITSLSVVLATLLLLWMVFARLNQQLVELSARDALTRVFNRNGLNEVLARHFGAREASPLTLLQIDIDHFKRINTSHGYEAGDAMLRAVASVLVEHVRGNDFVARTGGDEFTVGCVAASPAAALVLGERLRQGVAQLRVPWPGAIAALRCTVSIGVSGLFTERAHWNHAARQAERALYAAKSTGRDRVVSIEGIDA